MELALSIKRNIESAIMLKAIILMKKCALNEAYSLINQAIKIKTKQNELPLLPIIIK